MKKKYLKAKTKEGLVNLLIENAIFRNPLLYSEYTTISTNKELEKELVIRLIDNLKKFDFLYNNLMPAKEVLGDIYVGHGVRIYWNEDNKGRKINTKSILKMVFKDNKKLSYNKDLTNFSEDSLSLYVPDMITKKNKGLERKMFLFENRIGSDYRNPIHFIFNQKFVDKLSCKNKVSEESIEELIKVYMASKRGLKRDIVSFKNHSLNSSNYDEDSYGNRLRRNGNNLKIKKEDFDIMIDIFGNNDYRKNPKKYDFFFKKNKIKKKKEEYINSEFLYCLMYNYLLNKALKGDDSRSVLLMDLSYGIRSYKLNNKKEIVPLGIKKQDIKKIIINQEEFKIHSHYHENLYKHLKKDYPELINKIYVKIDSSFFGEEYNQGVLPLKKFVRNIKLFRKGDHRRTKKWMKKIDIIDFKEDLPRVYKVINHIVEYINSPKMQKRIKQAEKISEKRAVMYRR